MNEKNTCRRVEFVFQNNKGPKWQRTVFYDFDSDDIFVPAQCIMSEMMALLALGYDGTSAITHKNHIYVPLKWAKKETKDKELLEEFKTLDKKIRGDLKPWKEYE